MKKNNAFKGFAVMLAALSCIFVLANCPAVTGSNGGVQDPANLPSAPGNFVIYPSDTYATLTWKTPVNDGGSEITGYQISGGPTASYSANWVGISESEDAVLSVGEGRALVVHSFNSEPAEDIVVENGSAQSRAAWMDVPLSGLFTTSAVVDGLENGTSYTFEIRAINENGGGKSSGTKTVTPAKTGAHPNAPSKPLDFKVVLNDGEDPKLTWTKPNDRGSPITGYQWAFVYKIYYNEDTYSPEWMDTSSVRLMGLLDVIETGPNTMEWVVPTGYDQLTYYYQIRAVNSFGGGESSGILAVLTPPNPDGTISYGLPSAPIDVTAEGGPLSMTVRWITPANNGGSSITGYEYSCSTSPISTWDTTAGDYIFVPIPGSNSTTTSYTFTGLTANQNYPITVRARNANGLGAWSVLTGAKPLNAEGIGGTPKTPLGFQVIPGNGEVKLQWGPTNNNGTPITKFQYQYGIAVNNMGPWTDMPGSDHITQSYIVKGLTNNTSYRFAVRAHNSFGAGGETSQMAATPAANLSVNPPSVPSNFKAVGVNNGVDLTWGLTAQGSGMVISYQI